MINLWMNLKDHLILKALEFCNGNQIKTSKILGINRNTLRSKLKKLKISSKHGK